MCDRDDPRHPDTSFSHTFPGRFARIRSWWLCDRDDPRPPDTSCATPSPADSLAYAVGGCVTETTARPPDTSFSHTLPSRFARIRRRWLCDRDDPRHPDTSFSHTLPSRFARRLRRLAHPSHALASPPAAAPRGARPVDGPDSGAVGRCRWSQRRLGGTRYVRPWSTVGAWLDVRVARCARDSVCGSMCA